MTIDDYRLEDILFSTANPNYAFTVVAIDYENGRVRLCPNYYRVGDKIAPNNDGVSYWRNATAGNLYLFKRVRKAAKIV